ncbi:MAG: hypothetical protein DI527_00420 [Chelatococcus sp.]|nr:MAG: hypothetical protein DI527_00420 [Chelatococcus sp.]
MPRAARFSTVMTKDWEGKSVPLMIPIGSAPHIRSRVVTLVPRGFSGTELRLMRSTGQQRECARRLARMKRGKAP